MNQKTFYTNRGSVINNPTAYAKNFIDYVYAVCPISFN